MAHFEKREWSENTWHPEIAGVDFTERLHRFMGEVAMDGSEIYTAWLVTEDNEIQITPETSRVFISLIDDDSDTITVLDPTDGLWFNFLRVNHAEYFDTIRQLVSPWATVTCSLTPQEEVYKRFLKTITSDTEGDIFIPDDWTIGTED
jgi:hypothetical protein